MNAQQTNSIQSFISVGRIPPLNPTMLALLQALDSSESDADDLQKLILADANTSATILKIANSPFYGMNKKIQSVRDACVLLGFHSLRNIVYATALESFESPDEDPTLMPLRDALRQHTRHAAAIAVQLARQVKLESSTLYTLGLLHELGKQITLAAAPNRFRQYTETASFDIEAAYRDISAMCTLGGEVAKSWHLPDLFQHCIRFYPAVERCPQPSQRHTRIIYCAHILAGRAGSLSPGEDLFPPDDNRLADNLTQAGITMPIDELLAMATTALDDNPT